MLAGCTRKEEGRRVREVSGSRVWEKGENEQKSTAEESLGVRTRVKRVLFPSVTRTYFHEETQPRSGRLTQELAHRTHPQSQETARALHILSPIRVPLELPALLRVDVLEVLCLEARPSLYKEQSNQGNTGGSGTDPQDDGNEKGGGRTDTIPSTAWRNVEPVRSPRSIVSRQARSSRLLGLHEAERATQRKENVSCLNKVGGYRRKWVRRETDRQEVGCRIVPARNFL